ncbi:MAG: flippase-like domain-containing protein [Gemmatimonadetes bacterium]|nr:flippase-like domain-containing protein [Gemmatimonadota bacterium]
MKWDWKALLGIVVSGLLIWWILRGVELGQVWAELRQANLWLLLAAVAVATSGFLIRAIRWEVLLHPVHPNTSLHSRFAAVNIGFATNNLLPVRMGEFARAWSISRLEPVSASAAVGSLVVERMLDSVAILGLLLVAVASPSFPREATLGGRPVEEFLPEATAVIAFGIVFLGVLIAFPITLVRALRGVARWLPGKGGHQIVELAEAFLVGLGALRSPRLLATGLLWSFVFWGWNAISFLLGMWAFGIHEGYVAALFLQAVIAVGVALPAAPGFFGTFHAAAVVALNQVYGAAEGTTMAFAFGYHLGGFIPVTLMGLWYAWRLGFTMADLGGAEGIIEAELDRSAEASGEPDALVVRREGEAAP